MSETTLAQPLSGEEVIKSVCHEVARMLRQDCFLSPNMAYESFNAKIHIEIKALDCGRIPEITREIVLSSDKTIDPNDENAALEIADSMLYDRPPNEVRQESDQPIPTLVETPDGRREIKPVKYGKKIIDDVKDVFTLPPDGDLDL